MFMIIYCHFFHDLICLYHREKDQDFNILLKILRKEGPKLTYLFLMQFITLYENISACR